MAIFHNWCIFLSLVSLAHLSGRSWAAGWVVTRYYEATVTTKVDGFEGESTTIPPYVNTETVYVTPTADHPSALHTQTSPDRYQSQLTFVDVELAHGQGKPVPERRARDGATNDYTDYYAVMTYTWAASCSSTLVPTMTKNAIIDVPRDAESQVTPTSIDVSTITRDFGSHETNTRTSAYLDPADLPSDVVSSARASSTPAYYDNCGKSPDEVPPGCRQYTFRVGGKKIGHGYCCPDGCHHIYGLSPVGAGLAAGFSVFGLFLLVGICNSVSEFTSLMKGQKAARGLPFFFCCLIPVVTCPLLFFTRRGFESRLPPDQLILRAQWSATPFKKKFLLWLKYGFRFNYPPMLGTPPPKAAGFWRGNDQQHVGDQTQTQPETQAPPMREAQTEPSAIPSGLTPLQPAVAPPPTYDAAEAGPSVNEYDDRGGGPGAAPPVYSSSPLARHDILRK